MVLEVIFSLLAILFFCTPIFYWSHWFSSSKRRGVLSAFAVLIALLLILAFCQLGKNIGYALYDLPLVLIILIILLPISIFIGRWVFLIKSRSTFSKVRLILAFFFSVLISWCIAALLYFSASYHQQQRIQKHFNQLPICSKTVKTSCKSTK